MTFHAQIAFDERPGNSGPARYVASICRALSPDHWTVHFTDAEDRPGSAAVGTTPVAVKERAPAASTSRSRLGRLAPRFATTLLGFRREARRKSHCIPSNIHIFHAQNTGCEEMPVAARMAGVPRVLGTFHVDSTYDLNRQRGDMAHRAMEWYSNRSLHRAIAVSEATKRDWIGRTGIPEHRVVTIHNGIDPEHFCRRQSRDSARAALRLPQDAVILGGLGRLDAAKGFAYLIEALAHLSSEFPQAIVAIAGTGGLREQLEAKAAALGLADRVAFLGFQSDVNAVLDACDVFVLSSLCEALPFALLEAMAHELPTVGTTVGGVPEVILPGETGFLAPAKDGTALAGAIRPLLESADLRERLGRAGRERVIKHFHERDMVRKTIDVYRQLIASRAATKVKA